MISDSEEMLLSSWLPMENTLAIRCDGSPEAQAWIQSLQQAARRAPLRDLRRYILSSIQISLDHHELQQNVTMSILALPTEIFYEILRLTTPRSFEALLLSCSRLYHAGQVFLPRHNRLCRRFRHFRYDRNLQCSHELLHAIHTDPIIAEYIETADFSSDKCPDPARAEKMSSSSRDFSKILILQCSKLLCLI